MGEYVNEHQDIASQIVNEGHLITNHTYTHPSLPALDDNRVLTQLRDTNAVIQNVTGKTPEYFRPPYGETDGRVDSLAGTLGLTSIIWSIDINDGQSPGVDAIFNTLMSAQNGSIILCHDALETSNQTLEAVDKAIPQLQGRGLQLVTLSELLVSGVNSQQQIRTNFLITIPHPCTPPIAQPTPGQKYGVQPGDDLSKIAEKAYGDGREQSWKKNYEANKNLISDPSKIEPGWVVVIP